MIEELEERIKWLEWRNNQTAAISEENKKLLREASSLIDAQEAAIDNYATLLSEIQDDNRKLKERVIDCILENED